ncbi:PHD finger protein rhinoceros [Eupeodes corollae]|uniref:PHD finger protein rhinoceros n=1 Tax=Eupeodes corollae TaxID=290404 RepID=UPI0024930678|nr:PHD finger protein rhinoceros [Eupeodes corollae]
MESNSKSNPSETPKQNKKNPSPQKKKKKKSPSKASQTKPSSSTPSSSSSSKNTSNSNQSAGRHSDHNDRRDRYHYHRHSNSRDQRERTHYNSNHDSERNFNKKPYQNNWKSSGKNSYNNRNWKRPYSKHTNKKFQNYNNNFRREEEDYYHNNRNFQNDGPFDEITFDNSENQQFWHEDSISGQLPVPAAFESVIKCAEELLKRGFCDPGGGVQITDNYNKEEVIATESLVNVLEKSNPNETEAIAPNKSQELSPEKFEQIDDIDRTHQQHIYDSLKQGFLISQNEEVPTDLLPVFSTNESQGYDACEQFEQFSTNPEPNTYNDLFTNIKTERPEEEFNLEECINSNNSFPSISVIPISRLIKSEIQDINRADLIAPTTPNKEKRSQKPNLVQRKKSITKDGSLTENIVQRVANMDKVGIKNVINSSGTKYDAALKIQARKRLREEIRKQLKSMNFNPPGDNENNVLIPDEIVDSMSIPAVVLDEIRKAFGIVLVEDKNSKTAVRDADKTEKPDSAEKSSVGPPPAISTAEPAIQPTEVAPKSPDLRSRIKMLEDCKSQTEKSPPIKVEQPRRSRSTQPILIIDSSSSSSSESSSSSDSDSSSTSSGSNCSNSSSFKRRRRKKRILEANVVGNFEKLILPNLTLAQRRRYKEKYSKTTKNSLLYIYGVCVSRANRNNTSSAEEKEQLKVKQNLSSADNAQALEFLMKAILNLFEKQKETLKKSKAKNPQIKSSNPISTTSKKLKDTTCNEGNSDDDKESTRRRSESANSGEFPKHQSTASHKLDKTSTKGRVNDKQKDSIAESANSASRVSSDDGAPVTPDLESDTESTSDKNPPLRQWKSPGEKKCVEVAESTSLLGNLGTFKPPLEIDSALSNLGMMQSPLANYSFDIESLKSQSSIGDEAVSSIREIDVKLMELHKRKMYIEEMILKLQKDKMEVDLWTMKLQNEKFILLNSALASVSSNAASSNSSCVKRKVLPISIAEKLQNRNKHNLVETINNIVKQKRTKRISNSSMDEEKSEDNPAPKRTRSSKNTTSVSDGLAGISSKKVYSSEPTEEAVAVDTFKKVEEKDEDLKTVEMPKVDYTNVPNGNLEGWKLPITQIIVVGEAIVAASEDGNIYKFNIRTRELESKFSKHTEAITQIYTCPRENFVYTTSLDGYLKKTSIENFGLELQSVNIQEPLQSIDIEWCTAFIGSRWGNIFTYDIKNNSLSESLLCSSGSSIIAIRATKEGPRKILIVSSKGNQINFRDAMTGLLLRSLDISDSLHIYSILLDDGCVYCGTQRNEIHQYNFTTGGRLAIFRCGNGAVSMKLYKDRYIFVGCYDGFVYVLDKKTGCQIGRFPGSGKMILALEIAGDKLITSAKDNTMQIIDIPKYIATIKDKS